MVPLFLGLTLANIVCLITATVLGYLTTGRHELGQWHMLAGALAALTCCAVHCIVFTYFIATAKFVQHAIAVRKLDESLATPTRSFRAQAFPAALASMLMVFLTTVMGAAVDNYPVSREIHHIPALVTIAVNLVAAVVEYHAIRRNGELIDRVLELANSNR